MNLTRLPQVWVENVSFCMHARIARCGFAGGSSFMTRMRKSPRRRVYHCSHPHYVSRCPGSWPPTHTQRADAASPDTSRRTWSTPSLSRPVSCRRHSTSTSSTSTSRSMFSHNPLTLHRVLTSHVLQGAARTEVRATCMSHWHIPCLKIMYCVCSGLSFLDGVRPRRQRMDDRSALSPAHRGLRAYAFYARPANVPISW